MGQGGQQLQFSCNTALRVIQICTEDQPLEAWNPFKLYRRNFLPHILHRRLLLSGEAISTFTKNSVCVFSIHTARVLQGTIDLVKNF